MSGREERGEPVTDPAAERPADAARRALRAAREEPVQTPGAGDTAAAERPADAARRALRAARERGSRGEAPAPVGPGAGETPPVRDDLVPPTRQKTPPEATPTEAAPHPTAAPDDGLVPDGGPFPGGGPAQATDSAVGGPVPAVDSAVGVPAPATDSTVRGPASATDSTVGGPASAADSALRGSATGDLVDPGAPDVNSPRPTARPGDIAREALRAARAQARRNAAEPGEPDAGRPRPSARTRGAERPAVPGTADPFLRRPSRPRDPAGGDRKARERARLVRESLADAFRMPSDDLPPSTAPDSAATTPDAAPRPTPAPDRAATTPDIAPRPTPAPDRAATTPDIAPRPTPAPDRAATTPDTTPRLTPRPTPTLGDAPRPGPAHEPYPTPLTPAAFPGPPQAASAPTPVSPRSMAAPSRDGEHRRTFPAFPALPGPGEGEEARFAETWWGHAWVAALEEGALDVKRLARGRGYAQRGHVDAITVTPGLVLAYVQGSRPRPYRVQVRLRTLGDEDWERFLAAAVDRPAHIAALLDKEMPESLADCGVPLLPGPGDLEPHCSCPDRAHPCKHAAALCYQTARLLDADPFVLLLLRGRGERELLDALSRRNAARAARAAQEREPATLPGVRATEVFAPGPARRLPPLPAPLPVPPHPEQPPAYPSAPNGPDSFALDQLATDAAARAHALLATGHDEIGELTLWQDAVRLAAARPGSGLTLATRALYASLASAAGRTPSELARAVAAWRQGGPDGLTVLEEPWDPPAGRFDRARPLLLAADLPAFRPWRNHLTHPGGHVQLRFGRDGLWYPYESEPGHDDWWPRGTPDPDPVGALTGLGGTEEP
ncbi:SWIM zinc finger family protein [Streptomyces sp. YKOK-I1]